MLMLYDILMISYSYLIFSTIVLSYYHITAFSELLIYYCTLYKYIIAFILYITVYYLIEKKKKRGELDLTEIETGVSEIEK